MTNTQIMSARSRIKWNALATVSATAMILAAASQAQAQTVPAAEAADEIIVTGTRVVRDGYEAPTPITVVGVEELQDAGTSNVADYVNTLPAFVGSRMPTNTSSTMSSGGSGINAINLRSLGLNRTLVLIDGQRSVGSSSDGLVDINTIPQALVARLDVVTGGASAAYGSDAVAGVVNFILDREFTGLKGQVAGDVTTYGDNESWDTSLTYGTPFASGRGHFLFSASVNDVAGVRLNRRGYNLAGWQIVVNPAYGTNAALGQSTSVPQNIVRDQSSVAFATVGGIITNTGLAGTAFGEGGRAYPFPYGPIVSNPVMVGGGWQTATTRGSRVGPSLTSQMETQNVFLRTSYDLSDAVTVFAQASWTHNQNRNWCCTRQDTASLNIRTDNAFIPSDVLARANALGITQFTMGSLHGDTRQSGAFNDRRVQRYVVGANGAFDAMGSSWTWDAYYQKGIAHLHQETFDVVKRSAFNKALDNIRSPVTGLPVCRVNADADPTNDDRLCVPYNIFGTGVNSPEAIDYLHGNGERDFRTESPSQDVMAASVSGEPFELWAGAVSLAFGVEHRKEKIKGVNDPVSAAFDWNFGNYQVFRAKLNVTEAFVETVVPLAVDEPFAKTLEFNGAIRATDYSASGYVTTWKLGLTWAPVDDIRFRLTRSRDIRAPNLQDLYNTGTSGFPGYLNPFRTDPVTGAAISELGRSRTLGNPNLRPEKSDMTGIGAVIQPSFLPGFNTSVDYWNLNIKDALGSLSTQQIIDQCFTTQNPQICGSLDFNADRTISLIRVTPFNLVNQVARGIDIEAGYTIPADTLISSMAGNLSVRFMATHFIKRYESNGIGVPVEYAGQNTVVNNITAPNWKYRAAIGYTGDTFDFNVAARGVSSGVYLNSNIECQTGCPVSTVDRRTVDENDIAGAVYFDTAVTYKFGVGEDVNMEAFFNVQNVFDRDPAIVAPGPGGDTWERSPINASLYDVMGRTFRAGLRFRM